MPDYARINQLLYEGNAEEVFALIRDAIDAGHPVEDVLENGLIAGMSVVGEDFKHNRLYVPEVLMAARAMKSGLKILQPLLTLSENSKPAGTLVMGTVKGDLHDIGKNLVCMMAEGAGFNVIDIGVDQAAENFVRAAQEHNADIVGMSALLTTTMTYMKTVVDALSEAGLDHVQTCVGGAPVSQMHADEVGADGYAADASSAVDLFKSFTAVLARE